MPDPLALFGAITGAGGLTLGAINTWHNMRAEPRAQQSQFRADLSTLLNEVEEELSGLGNAIRFGEDVPAVGPATNSFQKRLKPIARELDHPLNYRIQLLASEVSMLYLEWGRAVNVQSVGAIRKSDSYAREWSAAVSSLRERIEPTRDAIKNMREKIRQHDKRSLKRFWPS